MSYFYLLGTIVFTVYGQFVVKWRVTGYGSLPDGVTEKLLFLLRLCLDPYILSGFVAAFIAALFWMAAMTKFDLSFAYPIIISGLLILTSFLGAMLMNEPLDVPKIAGMTLILLGVVVMFSSGQ